VCEEKCASESNPKPRLKPKPSSADVAERGIVSIGVHSSGNLCVDEEYVKGETGAQSTTYVNTRVDSPAGLLDLPVVGLQQLCKLSVCECVKDVGAQGKETGVQMMQPHAAFGWRIHCGVEITELSTNKQHTHTLNIQSETQISLRSLSVLRTGWVAMIQGPACVKECERKIATIQNQCR
jgi:hypothetical protein